MPEVAENWNDAMRVAIRAELDRRELSYVDNVPHELLVPFEHDDGRALTVAFLLDVTPTPGLVVSAVPAAPIPRERWAAALVAINNWNATTMGVKAHLFAADWAADETASIFLQTWLPTDARARVDAAQLESVVDAMFTACGAFLLPELVDPAV